MKPSLKGISAIALVTLGAWVIVHCLKKTEGEQTPTAIGTATKSAEPPAPEPAAFPELRPAPKAPLSTLGAEEHPPVEIGAQPEPDDPRRYEENIPAAASVLRDSEADDTVRNEAANLLRRWGHEDLTDNLVEALKNPNEGPRFRSFCVQHLWQNSLRAGPEEVDKIAGTLYEALENDDLPVRREALLALVRMEDPKGRDTAVKWLTDGKGDGARDLAIRCAYELDLKEHIPIIREYAQKPNAVVQIAAVVALSQWGDEESRPVFEKAAKSRIVRLQRAGEAALKRLDEKKRPE